MILIHKIIRKLKQKYNSYLYKSYIGKKTTIGQNTLIDTNCKIGNYSYIGNNCNVTKTKIGNYCSIANNVNIGPGNHDYSKISTNTIFLKEDVYKCLTEEDCKIGSDVWIGCNVTVLRGVTIGDGAVIGSGAVVTKDVPDYGIMVGVPAKLLKYRFDKETISKLQKSKWWNLNYHNAKKIITDFEKEHLNL